MFLSVKKFLLSKEEVTYGSDPTPVIATDHIDAENIKLEYASEIGERNPMRGHASPVEPVNGKPFIKLSFDVEWKGSGSIGVASKLGDLIEACWHAETASVGSSVIYLPSSGSQKSVTHYFYELQDSGSAILHKIKGARGTYSWNATAGKTLKFSFVFYAPYVIPVNVADPGVPTPSSVKPPIVETAQLTLNGVTSLLVQEVSFDLQNNVEASESMNATGNIDNFSVTGRKPSLKLNPEAVGMSVYDFWTEWRNATARALSLVIGSTSGNKVTISMPKLTIDAIEIGERNGRQTRELAARVSMNSGNDEIQYLEQ